MSQRWYHSRTNQAALIGGAALLLATAIGGIVAIQTRPAYPTIEVKDLTPTGERVLARLALSPTRQLVDSAAFAALQHEDLLWNDSLGVAIAAPTDYVWSVSYSDSLETVSIRETLFHYWLLDQLRTGFGNEALEDRVRFFSVRLDHPTIVTIGADASIDSTKVRHNPFKDTEYFVRWMRTNYGDALEDIPVDTLAVAYQQLNATLDSIAAVRYPLTRRLLNGVFVGRVQSADLATGLLPWVAAPLLDRVVASVAEGTPTLLVIDRDRGSAIFSSAVQLQDVALDGVETSHVMFNRAGYAVARGDAVYVVMLQYLSNQSKAALEELQRLLESVRIRTDAD